MTYNTQPPRISNKTAYSSIFLILLLSTLPYSTYLPNIITYVLVLLAYVVFVVYAVSKRSQLIAPKYAIISLSVIWLIYLVHLTGITGLSGDLVMRVPIFITITAVNVFYLPYIIKQEYFLSAVSRLSAIAVVVGLPSVILGSYGAFGIEVSAWHPFDPLITIGGVKLYALKSFFQNPNAFGILTLAGALAALYELDKKRTNFAIGVFLINSIGLLLSNSRSAILAGCLGIVLYLMYVSLNQFQFRVSTVVFGLVGLVLFVLVVLPSPLPIDINLTGRLALWEGGIRATLQNPIIGLGPGDTGELIRPFVEGTHAGAPPHNSYIRMFVTTGIVGGIVYLFLLGRAGLVHLVSVKTKKSAAIFVLLVAFIVSQIFESYSLFGLSSSSVLASLTLGYSMNAHL